MKIFVSHSRRDKALIREIASHLPTYIRPWLDEEQLLFGMNLEASIRTSILSDANYVITFFCLGAATRSGSGGVI
jgi:hypothetical protein